MSNEEKFLYSCIFIIEIFFSIANEKLALSFFHIIVGDVIAKKRKKQNYHYNNL